MSRLGNSRSGSKSNGGKARLPRGEGPWAWLSAASVTLSLMLLGLLLLLLVTRGLGHFWPSDVALVTLQDGRQLAGRFVDEAPLPDGKARERLLRVGNRDLDGDGWCWLADQQIRSVRYPEALVVLQRTRWGEFIGYLDALEMPGTVPATGAAVWPALDGVLVRMAAAGGKPEPAIADVKQRVQLKLQSPSGQRLTLPLDEVLSASQPNAMSGFDKLKAWAANLWRFLSQGPMSEGTSAGTAAGGVWPAIFGTVLMVMLMSLLVTPFGVLAAVYLNEVAHQGRLTRLVRIGVRNLAGVPSIVYGVFGLGVFVYGIGGQLDRWFFETELPSPTFGTGGLLWASLTLALLTLPVVIVATEEGLARIPDRQREGALALGATRLEMLTRVVLPMARPAMLTGVILAVARAAGEVAPLMLVGVARLAPQVPLDGEFPYLHLERKFMHLGYQIFDMAFHGDDSQALLSLIYATALLLVLVIVVLNLTAIFLRHHLRLRHGMLMSR